MASKFKKNDPVFVNGRSGKVTVVKPNNIYTVETDGTGFIQDYPAEKLSHKRPRCLKCKRTLPDDYDNDTCGFCRDKQGKD